MRSAWIDNTRGVAIVLVVVGHSLQFGARDYFDFFTNPVWVTIYAFHMPLFAMISGYLAFSSFGRRTPLAVVVSRVTSILVPYVAWTVIGTTAVAILGQLVHHDFNASRVLQAVGAAFLFPGATLWFLWFLFLSYLFLALAVWAEQFVRWASLPISIVLVFAIPLSDQLEIYELRWLYPFFVAGYLLHRYRTRLSRYEILATSVSLVSFVLLLLAWQRDDSVYISHMDFVGDIWTTTTTWFYRYLVAGVGIIAAVGIIRWMGRISQIRSPFGALGRASLGIYCVQTYLFFVVRLFPSPGGSPWWFALYVALVTVVVIAASYWVTHFVLERVSIFNVILLGARRRNPSPAIAISDTATETESPAAKRTGD